MVSLLSSLNMTANTLSVNEKAISVVSHNVANMNTEGYHKQRVNLATRNIAGMIGNNVDNQIRANGGVKIANVMRYNDDYLNNYYHDQLSQKNKLEQQLANLGDLAGIFDDLEGSGIDAALTKFFEALNNLNEYPASATARTNFVETAKTLTSVLNTKSIELDQLTGKALGDGESQEALENSKIYVYYRELNNSLEELAAVNKALQTTQTGTLTANNLLDKRDLIINDIAQYIDIRVEERPNGSVALYTGDVPLVKGAVVTGKLEIETAKDYCKRTEKDYSKWDGEKAIISIVNPEKPDEKVVSNANDIIQGGALGGLIHSATDYDDGTLNAGVVQNSLNKMAQALADIFNKLNTRDGAYCIDPEDPDKLTAASKDNLLFVGAKGDGNDVTAGNIKFNPALLSEGGIWKIACAYFGNNGQEPELDAVGNSQNVVDMLNTRSQKQKELDNMSVEDYYTTLLGKIASAGSTLQTLYDTQCDVVEAIENQIDGAYGVDLNEELIDLVKYQTAYSAAARVFNTCNNCLDVLMNLGR